jgi:intracellular septation protein
MAQTAKPARGRPIPPLIKLGLDLGPLVIFFFANWLWGIYAATGVFMAAMLVSVGVGILVERKLSPVPLITGALVLVFGGLTLWLANDTFIKIKPTILYTIFACVLIGGLAMGRLFIKNLLSATFNLPDRAWRVLTWRWAIYFFAIAALNEIVWRNATTDQWVAFKVWGIFPLTLLFAFAQTPFLLRNQIDDPPPSP